MLRAAARSTRTFRAQPAALRTTRFANQSYVPIYSLKLLSFRTFTASCSRPTESFTLNSLDTFTEEEEMLRESVKRFANEVVGPKVREMDERESMDPGIIKGFLNKGNRGTCQSRSLCVSYVRCPQYLGEYRPAATWNKEQQDKWLPQLSQSKLGSFCLSEPASGSDAFALQTRAEKDGDHWVINGSKMWITNAYEAEIFLIFANVDLSKGYKGITCFIATKDMGIKIAKKEEKLGIRASSTCALNFDDLRIPAENVIGGEGKGYKIAIEILNEGRIGIAAQMLGLAQGASTKLFLILTKRSQFGQPVGTFQEEGKSFTKEAAMAKYWASVIAQRVSGQAIEWAGGVGFTRETGIEKFWRDSKIGAIYEGTSNIQLQTIAKFIQKQYS
ncbi:acyl-CoA oxidase [Boletus reticuloceps]|uniref:short-chain 2-methylacyl-CoA dehydrogenase n=1 Tax=Boletus reticuloceps TaxID=495285 RepID=A0A8I2YNG2_9AGAM|nr:acyl-CoA oxidase [Boletus reticuloceps]